MQEQAPQNPLGTAPIWGLIRKYAIPAVIGMLVTAIYNITDQVFIGQVIGMYGNAATNVAFPLVTLVTALSLLFGFGIASNFNLNLGKGDREKAACFAGNGLILIALAGVILAVLSLSLLEPLMRVFGATDATLSLALRYTGITAVGIPFLLFCSSCSSLIRADGSPTYAMVSSLAGAMLNIGLDALFMFVFEWGIAGAAWATVIGQMVSALICFRYLFHFKTVRLTRAVFRLRQEYVKAIVRLGTAGFLNHFIMMLMQITMNQSLRYYGGLSDYGSDIPLAVVAVVSKINFIVIAFLVGIGQGCQPIFGFNYGAKRYERVRETYKKAFIASITISIIAFLAFQLFPTQIVSIFGGGSEQYFTFAQYYMRIFMLMMFTNGIQPLTTNFFVATGKARQGIFLSLSRQGLFLLPLVLLLPLIWGVDGILFAGPISDAMAVVVSILLVRHEMRMMTLLQASV